MAERYQNRSYTTARNARSGDPFESDREESDPLAELARLIGQTDPFGPAENSSAQVPPRVAPREQEYQGYRQDYPQEEEYPQEYDQGYQASPEPDDPPASAGPPQWIQRANLRREAQRGSPRESQREPQREVGNDDDLHQVRPAHRYSGQSRQAQPDTYYYQDEPAYAEPEPQLDPSRYDDALCGQLEQNLRREAYPDDPHAYQAGYDEDATEEEGRKRRGPIFLVVGILALAVVGTAAAYGYRTYFGAPRGEPPIIKADNSPTKIPAPSDGSTKLPDRMVSGDGTEKIVPREEQPVDVDSRAAGPRVVFPPPNQNINTAVVSVPPGVAPQQGEGPAGGPGTVASGEPRKIRTVAVRGDQSDTSALPVNAPPPAPPSAKSAPAARAKAPVTQANASPNGPLSLAPQAQSAPETRVAATGPTAIAPAAGAASGGYLVQLSSQRNEADAQASFRALQNKFPSVLGSQTPLIKRADLGEKGTYYRAMVGPFATSDEAAQFCGNLKSAGGQCIVQRN